MSHTTDDTMTNAKSERKKHKKRKHQGEEKCHQGEGKIVEFDNEAKITKNKKHKKRKEESGVLENSIIDTNPPEGVKMPDGNETSEMVNKATDDGAGRGSKELQKVESVHPSNRESTCTDIADEAGKGKKHKKRKKKEVHEDGEDLSYLDEDVSQTRPMGGSTQIADQKNDDETTAENKISKHNVVEAVAAVKKEKRKREKEELHDKLNVDNDFLTKSRAKIEETKIVDNDDEMTNESGRIECAEALKDTKEAGPEKKGKKHKKRKKEELDDEGKQISSVGHDFSIKNSTTIDETKSFDYGEEMGDEMERIKCEEDFKDAEDAGAAKKGKKHKKSKKEELDDEGRQISKFDDELLTKNSTKIDGTTIVNKDEKAGNDVGKIECEGALKNADETGAVKRGKKHKKSKKEDLRKTKDISTVENDVKMSDGNGEVNKETSDKVECEVASEHVDDAVKKRKKHKKRKQGDGGEAKETSNKEKDFSATRSPTADVTKMSDHNIEDVDDAVVVKNKKRHRKSKHGDDVDAKETLINENYVERSTPDDVKISEHNVEEKKEASGENVLEKESKHDDDAVVVKKKNKHKKRKKEDVCEAKEKSNVENMSNEKVNDEDTIANQWESAEFSTPDMKEKFLRLMGAHKTTSRNKEKNSHSTMAMNKQQEKTFASSLEKQFLDARQMTRGTGLGFTNS
ncbi:lysine-rich nucleolar protein 1-like isoform X3 [Xenia sp. Carnegie-2017]|uniref:lysine-rich nucleolar protein 1-like isoform X3 n=1 Tax=Xenia sp. Carnegie-2017 TaxID=2897299 RepID=UPI001F04C447|nr:lysine-rich nucleolar protein 1-like isoform X3 [Xenia sp. Carnegie-2017]